ncbi:apyrase-like [Armigeres subalbatus]|uniref:apyrase-like n=1 Tax=Armigeres subalbatus TaxID=124917 RepID=UPI002ED5EDD5
MRERQYHYSVNLVVFFFIIRYVHQSQPMEQFIIEKMISTWWSWMVLLALVFVIRAEDDLYELSIIHVNDIHARFEETNGYGPTCNPEDGDICMGGYARTVAVVKNLLSNRNNPLYLNAGDNFRGSLWYNVHRWNVTVELLNMLPADAMTIGNHDFIHGVDGVVPFLEEINTPVLLVNVDNKDEPEFKNYQKSLIIERNGRKIGLIGVMLKPNNADVGNLIFNDVTETVREESVVLNRQGVDIIVVISHCGFDVDKTIAEYAGPEVDIIVGGHSHTFLYSGENPNIPDVPQGEYPTVVTQENGHKVLVVQASAFTKLVGDIVLFFDENGIIQRWEGNPIYLGADVLPDPDVAQAMIPWKLAVEEAAVRAVGLSSVVLSDANCSSGECSLGSLIADSMVSAYIPLAEPGQWTYSAIALIPASDIRASLNEGEITYADVLDVLPYENNLISIELRGDYLLDILEESVAQSWDGESFVGTNLMQVSGLRVKYNVSNPVGERVVSLEVSSNDFELPLFGPLDPLKYYRVITNYYTSRGGNGFLQFSDRARSKLLGPLDNVAFEDYVRQHSPVTQETDGRIEIYS